MKLCNSCNAGVMEEKDVIDFAVQLFDAGVNFIVPVAHVSICNHCDEYVFDTDEIERWEALYIDNQKRMLKSIKWNEEARNWVPFDGANYLKMHYDLKLPDSTIIEQCWINAGKIHDHKHNTEYTGHAGVHIAVSIYHPIEDNCRQDIYGMDDLAELVEFGQISLSKLDVNSTVSIAEAIMANQNLEMYAKSQH